MNYPLTRINTICSSSIPWVGLPLSPLFRLFAMSVVLDYIYSFVPILSLYPLCRNSSLFFFFFFVNFILYPHFLLVFVINLTYLFTSFFFLFLFRPLFPYNDVLPPSFPTPNILAYSFLSLFNHFSLFFLSFFLTLFFSFLFVSIDQWIAWSIFAASWLSNKQSIQVCSYM